MILKGSQRGGDRQLAAHLLNVSDNDHVTLHELRGFIANDLHGALAEAHAISKATRCKQFLFSLSLNPPKGSACHVDALMAAIERAEKTLHLEKQPRAVVIHEKEGRRHAHVVWSRINSDEMKAVHMPFFKRRLNGLAKELYLEHGWKLPDGLRENGWKNPLNFSLAEWQQAKRVGLDPRETKQLFAEVWNHSDGLKSVKAGLEDRGYYLAAGDRRGFVAVDIHGEVYSVARLAGIKAKDLETRFGSSSGLPSVDHVRAEIRQRTSDTLREYLRDFSRDQRENLRPLNEERENLVHAQRLERERLQALQARRWIEEGQTRQRQFRKGIAHLWDVVTGKAARVRRLHDREILELHKRDVNQCEALFEAQLIERLDLQRRLAETRVRQREERMRLATHIVGVLSPDDQARREIVADIVRKRSRDRRFGLHR